MHREIVPDAHLSVLCAALQVILIHLDFQWVERYSLFSRDGHSVSLVPGRQRHTAVRAKLLSDRLSRAWEARSAST